MADKLELPNGIEKDGKVYKVAYLGEMTGKQQNYLINTKYKSPIEHVEHIFSDLLEKVETEDGEKLEENPKHIIRNMLGFDDITYLIVKLWEITFDERKIENAECSHCSAKNELMVELDKLEIISPESDKRGVVTLPKSELEATYQPLYYEALKQYSSNRERMLNRATTSTVAMRLEKLGEKVDPKEEDVENLPAKDIRFLQNEAPEYKRIDTTITAECKQCGEEFDHEMEVLSADFLAQ